MGLKEVIAAMRLEYLEAAPQKLTDLEEAVMTLKESDGRQNEAKRMAHAIAGTSGTVGLGELSQAMMLAEDLLDLSARPRHVEQPPVVARPAERARPARGKAEGLDLTGAGIEERHPPENVGPPLRRAPAQAQVITEFLDSEVPLSGTPGPRLLLRPGEALGAVLGFLPRPVDQRHGLRGQIRELETRPQTGVQEGGEQQY